MKQACKASIKDLTLYIIPCASQDLEHLISQSVDTKKANYVVITGTQVRMNGLSIAVSAKMLASCDSIQAGLFPSSCPVCAPG